MQKAAGEIASASHLSPKSSEKPGKDIVESLVEAKASSRQVEASIKAIRAGEEVIGSILDVMA
ncbi:MAG: hypothetical protein HQ498_07670 [Pseudohongiella sp.]|nr:hypothetical protein [Pseudohongiella sp.]